MLEISIFIKGSWWSVPLKKLFIENVNTVDNYSKNRFLCKILNSIRLVPYQNLFGQRQYLPPEPEECFLRTKFSKMREVSFTILRHVHAWTCVPTAISGGFDISEVPGCHLLRQMSSQWGSQKSLQGLVSHELTAYLFIFNLFKLNELWPYYQKHVNQITLNRATL